MYERLVRVVTEEGRGNRASRGVKCVVAGRRDGRGSQHTPRLHPRADTPPGREKCRGGHCEAILSAATP